jgi:hypothetical protein
VALRERIEERCASCDDSPDLAFISGGIVMDIRYHSEFHRPTCFLGSTTVNSSHTSPCLLPLQKQPTGSRHSANYPAHSGVTARRRATVADCHYCSTAPDPFGGPSNKPMTYANTKAHHRIREHLIFLKRPSVYLQIKSKAHLLTFRPCRHDTAPSAFNFANNTAERVVSVSFAKVARK